MICLTGDIHHMSMRTPDQRCLSGTEARAAREYVRIARSRGLKLTLFVTGRAAVEEPDALREIGRTPGVEIGGHGFSGRRPRWLYEVVFRRLLGRQNGPRFYQEREIRKTCLVLERLLGTPPRTWRNHAYKSDRNTAPLLAARGIELVSDEIDLAAEGPRPLDSGLVSLPLNVWPDHDTLAHGPYAGILRKTPPALRANPPLAYQEAGAWLKAVRGQVEAIVRAGGVATLLVHPACMEAADGFVTFAALCDFLSARPSVTASEAMSLAAGAAGPGHRIKGGEK